MTKSVFIYNIKKEEVSVKQNYYISKEVTIKRMPHKGNSYLLFLFYYISQSRNLSIQIIDTQKIF